MKKRKIVWIAVLTAALCINGCGGASHSNNAASSESYYSEPAAEAAYETGDTYYSKEEAADYETEGYGTEENTAGSGDGDSALREQDGQKIVYTGSLSIQTLEYDKSAASIRKKIKDAGGFSESESERDNNKYWYESRGSSSGNTRNLSITARIPSENFEDFVNSLSGDGQVMSRSVNAENISQIYANKETYKKALEKEQERLLAMMDKAETIEEMITVESRLSEVERQLNAFKTDLAEMDKAVQFSTVYIDLQEVKRYTEPTPHTTTFAEEIKYAFEDAVTNFKDFCEGIILFIVRNFPFLIILAIIITLLVRRAARNKAKQIAMMSDPKYAEMMNAKARAKAEAEARKRAEKEAKRGKLGGLFRKKAAPQSAPSAPAADQPAGQSGADPATSSEPVKDQSGADPATTASSAPAADQPGTDPQNEET